MSRPDLLARFFQSVTIAFVIATSAVSFFLIGTAAASPMGMVVLSAASPNGLVINEIFNSQNPANEYFELYNAGTVPINLSTYVIYNRDGATPLSNLADPIINPGQFRAIGPTLLGTTSIGGPTGLDTTDFLALVNTAPSDTVIDVVNFGNTPNVNWPNYDRFRQFFFTDDPPDLPTADGSRTLQRWPDGLDTDTAADFASIFSSPSTASCADPSEDDDTSGTAKEQPLNTPVLRRICGAGDVDWVQLSMSPNFTYTLRAEAVGTSVDFRVTLYDNVGNEIVTDDNAGSRNSVISFRPTGTSSATFRVQIADRNGGGSFGTPYLYTFTVTSQSSATSTPSSPTPVGCDDQYERPTRDDTRQTAKPIELNTEQVHTLCPPGDQDWLVFSAVGGKIYTMYTKDLSGPVDTVLTLYDSSGEFLFENDDYQPGTGLASRIDYTFSRTATYFLRVRDKRGSGGSGYQYTVGLQSSGALPATGTATGTATINPNTATPTSPPCGDSFEPDGVPEAAKLILIGSIQRHSICPATDADWVRFYARAGKVYTIRTGNLGIGLDTYMYLFDSNGTTILAQNDDGGENVASRIDFYPQRDDFYYVQVKNAGDLGGFDQTYELSLAVVPGVPQPPGTATMIIAPILTVTSGPAEPTTVVQPTRPALSTPTRAGNIPTPPLAPQPQPTLTAVTPGVTPPEIPEPTGIVVPTVSEEAEPTQVPAEPAPTLFVPGVPITGGRLEEVVPPKPAAVKANPLKPIAPRAPVAQPQQVQLSAPPDPPASTIRYAPILLTLFFDANSNQSLDQGEGIRGVEVRFVSNEVPLGGQSVITDLSGTGISSLPAVRHRISIPYFGINVPLARFPDIEKQSIGLPKAILPDRVP